MGTPNKNSCLPEAKSNDAELRLVTSDKSWIEGKAQQQLETTAQLPAIELAVGFPDLHPGKGYPIGAAFVSRDMFYPALAGNDIGCGMSFWQTDQLARKVKLDRLAGKLRGLDLPYEGDKARWLEDHELAPSQFDYGIGTIGGGNHFAELQQVHEVRDEAAFALLGLDAKRCGMLVHSGSRGLGQEIWTKLLRDHGYNGFAASDESGWDYLESHDYALNWASANRALIARRFANQARFDIAAVSDNCHNSVTIENWRGGDAFVHRKGAATSQKGVVMIPGSRGTLSYLVQPIGEQGDTAFSLAHGAGRRWQRGEVKPRLSHKFRPQDLEQTALGGRVICEDRELLYEEAPQAYKDIDQVVADLEQASLIKVIAVYKPMITYKCRRYSKEERYGND